MGEKSVALQSKCTHCIGAVLKNLGHSSGGPASVASSAGENVLVCSPAHSSYLLRAVLWPVSLPCTENGTVRRFLALFNFPILD